jgi:hypothetical protein
MGNTINDSGLKEYADLKSKCIRCCIALNEPQPGHCVSKSKTETQRGGPVLKTSAGRIINANGTNTSPLK